MEKDFAPPKVTVLVGATGHSVSGAWLLTVLDVQTGKSSGVR